MCIGLLLDTLVIMVLAKLFTDLAIEEDWIKPLVVAILASVGGAAASMGATAAPEMALLILGGALLSIAAFVTIGCWLIMSIEFGKAALIGVCFLIYKVIFAVFLVFVFAAAA